MGVKVRSLAKWLPLLVVIALAVTWRFGTQHWLAVHTGSSNTSGAPPNYNFWSGFGSDLSEITLVGAIIAMYRKHQCHDDKCWRIGRHQVDGSPWCDRHHQDARDRTAVR